ncbi:MAG: hypothetical protein ACUVTZ_08575 [Armatimonadota bacterium]
MSQLVAVLSGPTYQADMLKDELDRRGIPAVVRSAPPLSAYPSAYSGSTYAEVLVDERVLTANREDIEECLALVGEVFPDESH